MELDSAVDSVDVLPDPEPVEIVESPLDVVISFDLSVSPVEDTKTAGEPPIAAADAFSEPAVPADEPSLSPLAQTLANMAESMQGDLSIEATVDLDVADGPLVPLLAEAQSSATAPPPPSRSPPPPPPPLGPASAADAALTGDKASAAGPVGRLPEALSERPRRAKRSKPWFEEVFDESYLRTLPFMTAEQTLQEVDFIESSLGVPRGSEVLDVACGYGRHAIELVQRGLAVTGLDLSLPLLIRAADESQRRAVSVNFVHTDMREMSFEHQFSGAYCMLTSFGYFDDESNLKVAEAIARALKPGGRFLIDVINRDYIVGDLPSRVWWEGDGCVVLEEVDFNFNTNRVLTHRSVVFDDGQQLEHEISIRVYSLHELGKLLRQAGFRVIEVSGSVPTKGHFFGANSRNLMILAERRSE
jgi:SAM-dependent methyltransferase